MKEIFEFLDYLDNWLNSMGFRPDDPAYYERPAIHSTPPYITISNVTLQDWKNKIAECRAPGKVEYEMMQSNLAHYRRQQQGY